MSLSCFKIYYLRIIGFEPTSALHNALAGHPLRTTRASHHIDQYRNRTCDLLFRRQALYPTELIGHNTGIYFLIHTINFAKAGQTYGMPSINYNSTDDTPIYLKKKINY